MEKSYPPFAEKLVSTGESGLETDIHRFENDNRYVIKKLHIDEKIKKDSEVAKLNLHEFAASRYGESHKLFKKYLGAAVPEALFIIANDEDAVESLYIVQERIEGRSIEASLGCSKYELMEQFKETAKHLSIIGDVLATFSRAMSFLSIEYKSRYHQNFATHLILSRELDDLLCAALNLWEATRAVIPDKSIIGLSHDHVLRYRILGEGFLPEIGDKNLLYGKKVGDSEEHLYLIDNGIISIPENKINRDIIIDYNIMGDVLGYLTKLEVEINNPKGVALARTLFSSKTQTKLQELKRIYPNLR